MAALDDLPSAMLVFAVLGFFLGMPADGSWVEEDFRSLHGGESSPFGIPLVPANQHTDFAKLGLPGLKTEIAGG